MTRRENFLNTLLGEQHDYMPANVVIDNFNIPDGMGNLFDTEKIGSFQDYDGMIDMAKYYGLDVMIRIVPSVIHVGHRSDSPTGPIWVKDTKIVGNEVESVWHVGNKMLRSVYLPSNEANTTFLKEYAIHSAEDYDTLIALYNSETVSLNFENIEKEKEILEHLGNDGCAYHVVPATPIMDLARTWVGLENLIFDLADYQDKVEETLLAMESACYRQVEMIAKNSSCRILVFWDGANSLYLSPRMFEKYSVPVMKRYSEIAKKYGKILVCHTCEPLSRLQIFF